MTPSDSKAPSSPSGPTELTPAAKENDWPTSKRRKRSSCSPIFASSSPREILRGTGAFGPPPTNSPPTFDMPKEPPVGNGPDDVRKGVKESSDFRYLTISAVSLKSRPPTNHLTLGKAPSTMSQKRRRSLPRKPKPM